MVLIALVCRRGAVRLAVVAGSLGVLAVAVLGIPVTGEVDEGWWNLVLVSGFWSLAGLFAVASGCYLRWLDARRVRAVAHAHRTQRLRLATDLHDFVAHDVSAMVIRAQAAQVLLDTDPQAAGRLLQEIESDGTQALASMDRTIQVMRDLEAGVGTTSRTPLPGVEDLPELLDRYRSPGAGAVELDLHTDLIPALPRETSATVYRIVVEALTNVRRHAGPEARVTVSLVPEGEVLVLRIIDQEPEDVRASAVRGLAKRRSGGTGLRNLAQRVQALEGTFAAGPLPSGGWQVRAELLLGNRTGDGGGGR
nr:histidine kinase [Kineosporia rhizophila]